MCRKHFRFSVLTWRAAEEVEGLDPRAEPAWLCPSGVPGLPSPAAHTERSRPVARRGAGGSALRRVPPGGPGRIWRSSGRAGLAVITPPAGGQPGCSSVVEGGALEGEGWPRGPEPQPRQSGLLPLETLSPPTPWLSRTNTPTEQAQAPPPRNTPPTRPLEGKAGRTKRLSSPQRTWSRSQRSLTESFRRARPRPHAALLSTCSRHKDAARSEGTRPRPRR